MKTILNELFSKNDLTRDEAQRAMELLMQGQESPEQVSAFLAALKVKGETVDEIAGMVSAMRKAATPFPTKRTGLVDTCGTGGDGASTFNISTTAAFVLAGAGLGVAKHGNRSVSSKCGSADVLEALGIPIDAPPKKMAEALDKTGFAFLFAPIYHPSMKNVAPVRKALGVRTVFNILGPLTNPAGVKRQVIGVYDPALLDPVANVLNLLGSENVMVVHGADGLDELSLSGQTLVAHLKNKEVLRSLVNPQDFGLATADTESLRGGDADENAEILEAILKGEPGPKADAVVYNAAAGLWVSSKVLDMKAGVAQAREVIASGKALDVLTQLRNFF